jgi:hypothetical protein
MTVPPVKQPTTKPSPSAQPAKSPGKVEIPIQEAKSLDGIISYLTKKHGGNVHDKGIVTITSKSVRFDHWNHRPQNVADLTVDSTFYSGLGPHQWICWNFGERRVRPSHYTIRALDLKSWLVEGSLDGTKWKEIDRRTDSPNFQTGQRATASFPVTSPTECGFIRVTQTGTDGAGRDDLCICAVEFFGTLSE